MYYNHASPSVIILKPNFMFNIINDVLKKIILKFKMLKYVNTDCLYAIAKKPCHINDYF